MKKKVTIRTSNNKLAIVNFSNGTTEAAVVLDNRVNIPTFKSVYGKLPLVVFIAFLIHVGLLAATTSAVYYGGINLDFIPKEFLDKTCFGTSMPSTVFLAFLGVASLWLWEFNMTRRAPHLSIEMGYHRILRLSILGAVICLGIINCLQSANANMYTLEMEMIMIVIFFIVETTYHGLFVVYISQYAKFAKEQRRKSDNMVKKVADINAKNTGGKGGNVKINVERLNLATI